MSKKKFYFRNYIIIFSLVCIFLYIFQKYNNKIDLEIIDYGELEEVVNTTGIVIKDEAVLTAKSSGNIEYYYEEGEKVSSGSYLAKLSVTANSEQINQEIELVEDAIEKLESKSNNIITIQDSDSKYSGYNIDELKKEKQQLEDSLKNNKISYYAPKSGFVTYIIDGLESKFKINDVNNLTPASLSNIIENPVNTIDIENVSNGDNLVKVINNFNYYIACIIDNDDLSLYKEQSYIKVRFDDNENIIYGWIEKINTGLEQSVLIINFDDFFYQIYNKRIVKLQLITNVYEGIKISKKAVLEKDGMIGVYIKDISNIIKFLPIEIIGENDEYYIVSQGSNAYEGNRGVITINGSSYYTVKTFDKIVLDKDKVYEEEIID